MEINRDILVRYYQGESTEEEKNEIQLWLESNTENKRQFIHERIRFDASLIIDEKKLQTGRKDKTKKITLGFLKIASVILILVGSSYLFSLYLTEEQQSVMQSIYVPAGNRTSLTLPDGSLVWLNSNTTFTYPNVFTKNVRHVELNGEAYFEVSPDKEKTFVVKTDKYNIEVLGTSFNVDAYADKPDFEIALFTGKVKLLREDSETSPLFLEPGQMAHFIDNSLQVATVHSNNYRWRDGLIIIEDKSFEEIMQVFEKYYGQQIIIENEKVKSSGYRGKLRIADGIDHALRVLQNDVRFSYKREEETNRIYIY